MRFYNASTIALAAAALAAVACSKTEPEPVGNPTPTPVAEAEPAPQLAEQAKPEKDPNAVEDHGSESAVMAPFTLTVDGPEKIEAGQPLKVIATIVAGREFKVPTEITVTLPEGVTLKQGKLKETLPDGLQKGKTVREYQVELAAGVELKGDAPVKIKVAGQAPNGAYGAVAEKQYPRDSGTAKPRGMGKVPPPPVGRPAKGIPARQTGTAVTPKK